MTDERIVRENREITAYVLTHLGGEITRMRNAGAEEMHLEWQRHGGEEWSRELRAVSLLLDGVASLDVADSVGLPVQSVRRLRAGETAERKLKARDAATYVRMRKYYRAGYHAIDGLAAKAHVTRSEAEKFIETCRRSDRTKRMREAMGADKGVLYRRGYSKPWVVEITSRGKSYWGGSYATVQEANAAARRLRERIAHEAADTQ